MKDRKEIQLLKDIAELYEKHGAESFESLAHLFSNERFSKNISTILMEVYNRSKSIDKTKKKPSKTKSISSSIDDLKEESPEQATILLNIYDNLNDKTYLPTLKQIRLFCEDNALNPVTARSRKTAVNQLVKSLINLPMDEISKLQNVLEEEHQDRTLDGWSSIILNKRENEDHNASTKKDK